MSAINNILNKIPITIIILGYLGFLGYEYYDWVNSAQSELGQKKAQVIAVKTEIEQQKKKLAQGEEFLKNLETLKERIRNLAAQLESSKSSLSAEIDIANFVRLITLEANKLKISIKGIKPETEQKKDYYTEVPFTVALRGAYVQILVFFDRIAKFQQLIRISDFQMRPSGNSFTKYVELTGAVKLLSYKYLGTAADDITKKDTMKAIDLNQPPNLKTSAKSGGQK